MAESNLKEIDLDLIDRNPENPRIVFRPSEMAQLMDSIRLYGVQVPISVYREGKRFVLIDGERRWRCSIKLNLKKIPALVQAKPDRLTNLLLMFNIHALREQWDLLTLAAKLPDIQKLLHKRNDRPPTEKELSIETGLLISVIRRCKLLIALPEKYRQSILVELQKPKPQQIFTEDFFIEMERALKTVERNMPDVVNNIGKDKIREVLISKFKDGVITNRVDFRQIAKIARADKVSVDVSEARESLVRLFHNNSYSITSAYQDSVGFAYDERDLVTKVTGLASFLTSFENSEIDDDVREALEELQAEIDKLLGA